MNLSPLERGICKLRGLHHPDSLIQWELKVFAGHQWYLYFSLWRVTCHKLKFPLSNIFLTIHRDVRVKGLRYVYTHDCMPKVVAMAVRMVIMIWITLPKRLFLTQLSSLKLFSVIFRGIFLLMDLLKRWFLALSTFLFPCKLKCRTLGFKRFVVSLRHARKCSTQI